MGLGLKGDVGMKGTALDDIILRRTVAYVRVAPKVPPKRLHKVDLTGFYWRAPEGEWRAPVNLVQCWMIDTWQHTSARQCITSVHQ